ncbi:hypothetical protein B7494_g3722 [Chlorociboria aeruginascens]|nr:hypothetical protein B7494_g3722 [Chlorociboria aeruginascens]
MQVLPPGPIDFQALDLRQNLESDRFTLPSPSPDIRQRCIDAFYYHFYPAHPFVLPQSSFSKLLAEKSLKHLETAMQYIGSLYVAQSSIAALSQETEASIYNSNYPQDAFKVQAMLAFAIALDGLTYQEKALQILSDATDLALVLGMNKRDFASMNGNESAVLEESWRRTWWELFIIDGMIAGVHQKSSFRLMEVAVNVGLPCEENEYRLECIPFYSSISDFDDETFDGMNISYSSFTYRIAAIRNMGKVLQSQKTSRTGGDIVDKVDAHLVNWRLHLPDTKKTFITSDNQVDEMLFQAHMITEASTILLHRELAQLDSTASRNITSCAPHHPTTSGPTYNTHTAKIRQSAQSISKMITLPTPLINHTHFVTCIITLASIVHLSSWSTLMPNIQDDDFKQQLRLNIGGLKKIGEIWPSASMSFVQVKGIAEEIYKAKKKAVEARIWTNFTDEGFMRSMIEDQSIMEEFQLL